MTRLLSVYMDGLGALRDRAGIRRRLSRPVRQARDLDQYLLGDGLDAATITPDVRTLAEDPTMFGWQCPKYTEDLEGYPTEHQNKGEPLELTAYLRDWLHGQTERLSLHTLTTLANVGASAHLRQAIANTRLQRTIFILSVLATVIAARSLLVSLT